MKTSFFDLKFLGRYSVKNAEALSFLVRESVLTFSIFCFFLGGG